MEQGTQELWGETCGSHDVWKGCWEGWVRTPLLSPSRSWIFTLCSQAVSAPLQMPTLPLNASVSPLWKVSLLFPGMVERFKDSGGVRPRSVTTLMRCLVQLKESTFSSWWT